jgi:arylsulfatase A-like enzyme/lysophospholipase L1-like esterase
MRFPLHLAALVGIFLPVAPAGSLFAEQTSGQRPNVLFIAVDDLRPALGAYGDANAITPNLDALARSGALFERAYCQQAVCSPSRTALLTGLRPDRTGVYDLKTHFRSAMPEVVTLPQHFRNQGYRTVGRGKIYHGELDDAASWDSPPSAGRPLNGTSYALPENREPETPVEEGKPRQRRAPWEMADVPDDVYTDGILASEAEGLLKELKQGAQPFFLAVGFMNPHLPFAAPKRYWDSHDLEKLWPPPNRSLPEGTPAWVSQPGWELRNAYSIVPPDYDAPIPGDVQKTLRHGYYAATSYVDAQIGRLLAALDREGLAENTIVVLWGDHGYHVGDHGTWCKHTNFEVALHSPLLIRAPGLPKGRRIAEPVEFMDIYPTLAALCGLEVPSHAEGADLSAVLRDPAVKPEGIAFSQYPRGDAKINPMMGYSVRGTRWRYTEWLRTDTGEVVLRELYDLENDPHAASNVAKDPANAEVIAELSQRLYLAGRGVAHARSRPEAAKVLDPDRFEPVIAAFEKETREMPVVESGESVVFIGSSTFALWQGLAESFSGHRVINRAFGGSGFADLQRYGRRLLEPLRPGQVVVYCGSNDLRRGDAPEEVAARAIRWIREMREVLPDTRFLVLTSKLAPSRYDLEDQVRSFNRLLAQGLAEMHMVEVLDAMPVFLDARGRPDSSLYRSDQLHLNVDGNKRLRDLIAPRIARR